MKTKYFFYIFLIGLIFAAEKQPQYNFESHLFPESIAQVAEIMLFQDSNGHSEILGIFSKTDHNTPQYLAVFKTNEEERLEEIWQFDLQGFQSKSVFTSVTIGDLDGDGMHEIIASVDASLVSEDSEHSRSWLHVFEWDGSKYSQHPITSSERISKSEKMLVRPQKIEVYDFDQDGKDELILALGSPEKKVVILSLDNGFEAMDWRVVDSLKPNEITGYMNYAMTIGDIDGDQMDDINLMIVQDDIHLISYGRLQDGTFGQIFKQDFPWPHKNAYPTQFFTSDFDKDGLSEIVFTTNKNGINVLHRVQNQSALTEFRLISVSTDLQKVAAMIVSSLDNQPELWAVSRISSELFRYQIVDGGNSPAELLFEEFIEKEPALGLGGHAHLIAGNSSNYLIARSSKGQHWLIDISIEPIAQEILVESEIVTEEQEIEKQKVTEVTVSSAVTKEDSLQDVNEVKISVLEPTTPDFVVLPGEEFYHEIEVNVEALGSTRTIVSAPQGMKESGGRLFWIPLEHQLGFHRVAYEISSPQVHFTNEFFIYVNSVPEIRSVPDTLATVGRLYTYQVDAVDANRNSDLTFELIKFPSGMEISETGRVEWLPTKEQVDNQIISIRVSDGYDQIYQEFSIFCNDPIHFDTSPDTVVFVGETYNQQLLARDNNFLGERAFTMLEYPEGMTLEEYTGRIHWKPEGEVLNYIPVRFIATDHLTTDTLAYDIYVNAAPEIVSTQDTLHAYGEIYKYMVEVEDQNDGQFIHYTLRNAPKGMKIDSTGLVTWNPDSSQLKHHQYTIQVSDGYQSDEQEIIVFVNFVPVVYSSPDPIILVGMDYKHEIFVKDENDPADKITYRAQMIPKGAKFSEKKGIIRWNPRESQKGYNDFIILIKDPHGAVVQYEFSINVKNNPQHRNSILWVFPLVLAFVGMLILTEIV